LSTWLCSRVAGELKAQQSLPPTWESLSGPMRYACVTPNSVGESVSEVRLKLLVPRIGPSRNPRWAQADNFFNVLLTPEINFSI
jgi:hypothetical protein